VTDQRTDTMAEGSEKMGRAHAHEAQAGMSGMIMAVAKKAELSTRGTGGLSFFLLHKWLHRLSGSASYISGVDQLDILAG